MIYAISEMWPVVGWGLIFALIISSIIILPIIISKDYEKSISTFIAFMIFTIALYIPLAIIPYFFFMISEAISQFFIRNILSMNVNDFNYSFYVLIVSILLSITANYFIIKKLSSFLKRKITRTNPYVANNDSPIVMKVYSVVSAICSVEVAVIGIIYILITYFK